MTIYAITAIAAQSSVDLTGFKPAFRLISARNAKGRIHSNKPLMRPFGLIERMFEIGELVRLYSNPALSALALVELRVQSTARLRCADQPRARQAHHRLSAAEVAQLIAAYGEQVSIKELAERFGIHRVTVTALLRRHSVELRRAALVAKEVPKAASLYSQLWSLARLGSKYGVGSRHRLAGATSSRRGDALPRWAMTRRAHCLKSLP
jgi:DNA-binding CsgD family transcriptional regulator